MRALILAGVLLAVVGLGLAGYSFTRSTGEVVVEAPAPGEAAAASGRQGGTPFWFPVAAGLALAAGAALIGVGMGRWQRPRPRGEPGDDAVQPGPAHPRRDPHLPPSA